MINFILQIPYMDHKNTRVLIPKAHHWCYPNPDLIAK